MRKYGTWAVALAIVSAMPGMIRAEGIFSRILTPGSTAASQAKSRNQRVAEQIAGALRQTGLNGYDVRVEYRNGVAKLIGSVNSPDQRALASRIVADVPGVTGVQNQLQVNSQRQVQFASVAQSNPPVGGAVRQNQPNQQISAPGTVSNQQVAEQVASRLGAARLTGYGIEVRFQNGVVRLGGKVGNIEERLKAEALAAQVPGVQRVDNALAVSMETAPSTPNLPILPTGLQTVNTAPPVPQPGVVPPTPEPGTAQPALPILMGSPMATPTAMMAPTAPTPYAHPGPGVTQATFNMPNMPEHAWPAYAPYPNAATITYPQEYSASAWPYIGPFYPYPQVPMGWRKSTLEWDDGHWQLSFNAKTDKWFWFMLPRNWGHD